MKPMTLHRITLISSMLIFGTLGPIVRQISVSSGELALYRAVLAVLLIAPFLLFTGRKGSVKFPKRQLPLLLLSGCALGFNWILLFEAYKYTTVSVATLSYYFAPVIVTAVCPLLFREKMSAKSWICFCMSTLGIVLVTGIGNVSDGRDHFRGILLGLGAACLYATVVLLNKFIKETQGLNRTFFQFAAAILVLIPYVALTGGCTLSTLDTEGWLCLFTVGVLHTGIAYCLYFSAVKELPGQETAILSYIDPLLAVILSVTVLREKITLMQILGGILILGFTLWNEFPSGNRRNKSVK